MRCRYVTSLWAALFSHESISHASGDGFYGDLFFFLHSASTDIFYLDITWLLLSETKRERGMAATIGRALGWRNALALVFALRYVIRFISLPACLRFS